MHMCTTVLYPSPGLIPITDPPSTLFHTHHSHPPTPHPRPPTPAPPHTPHKHSPWNAPSSKHRALLSARSIPAASRKVNRRAHLSAARQSAGRASLVEASAPVATYAHVTLKMAWGSSVDMREATVGHRLVRKARDDSGDRDPLVWDRATLHITMPSSAGLVRRSRRSSAARRRPGG